MTNITNPSDIPQIAEHKVIFGCSVVAFCISIALFVDHLVHIRMLGNHSGAQWWIEFILLPCPLLWSMAAYRLLAHNRAIIGNEALRGRMLRIAAMQSNVAYALVILLSMTLAPPSYNLFGLQTSIHENSLKNVVLPKSAKETPPGNPIHIVVPSCPAGSMCAGVYGQVHLKITVGTDGSVQKIISGSGDQRLVAAWSRAVMQWRYMPFMEDGHPVPANITVALNSDGVSQTRDN